jgi:II/X family phage/plasmid replication protein
MLDSVKLRSPFLSEETAEWVERSLQLRQAVECETGLILWEILSGPVEGSYDHRVSVALNRRQWVSVPRTKVDIFDAEGRKVGRKWQNETFMEDCPPYLEVEGSVHKSMLGHNIDGGPDQVAGAIRWFVAELAAHLGLPLVLSTWDGRGLGLPSGDYWIVRRIDWAEVFDLGSQGVAKYLRWLYQVQFPRRKMYKVEGESVTAPGYTTTIKLYHKGLEFRVHDRPRLLKCLGDMGRPWVDQLQGAADRYLRVEVAIKARKLDLDFGGNSTVARLDADGQLTAYCRRVWAREVRRLMREGVADMDIVRHSDAVEERLFGCYSRRMAKSLHETWVMLSTKGEAQTKGRLGRSTFYSHRKMLTDSGIAWRGTDVRLLGLVGGALPLDFTPMLTDLRRVVEVNELVARRCAQFAA